MLAIDAELRAATEATAADEAQTEKKTDVTSSEDKLQLTSSSSPPAGETADNPEVETKCSFSSFRISRVSLTELVFSCHTYI